MIEKLTKKQKDLMEVYRSKWIKIGLSTGRFDFETAQKCSDYLYQRVLNKPKVPVIVADSPLSAWIIVNMFEYFPKLENETKSSVRASVRASVRDSVGDSVRASVRDSVGDSVRASVRASVRDSVRASVRASVRDSVRASGLISYIMPYLSGSFDANIFAFYDYFEKVLNIDYGDVKETWEWWQSTSKLGLIFPLENVCIISQKPTVINIKDGKLHADGKAALEYADGFKIWALNGVRVPQYLAETPASALDIEFFKKEQNADVKAEFIRKYGIERMVSMGKLVDTWENHEGAKNFEWYKKSEYKLIDMSPIFSTYNYLPYLYMKNQTVPGIYHLECCYNPNTGKQPKTILEGLTVRLNGVNPETLEITAIA